ncbi:MAG: hypothetical protein ACRD1X_12430 [Vicinamibacteria bacterium]
MTSEEYRDNLIMVLTSARTLLLVDVPDLLNRISRAETLGPLLDPTLWIRNHQAMEEDKELLEAALPLYNLAKMLQERALARARAECDHDQDKVEACVKCSPRARS